MQGTESSINEELMAPFIQIFNRFTNAISENVTTSLSQVFPNFETQNKKTDHNLEAIKRE